MPCEFHHAFRSDSEDEDTQRFVASCQWKRHLESTWLAIFQIVCHLFLHLLVIRPCGYTRIYNCRFRFWFWSVLQRTDCRDSTYGAIILWFDACFLTLSTESSWGIYINQSWRTAIMPSSLAAGSARRGTQQSWSGNMCHSDIPFAKWYMGRQFSTLGINSADS